MTWDSKTARAIELIYDSVESAEGWVPLLKVLATEFDSTGAHVFLHHTTRGEFIEDSIFGWDENFQLDYQRLAHTDPSWPISAERPAEIINDVNHYGDAFFESTPLYNEVMKDLDARYRITTVLPLNEEVLAGFAIIRSKSMGAYERRHVEQLELILPHMMRALQLQGRLRKLENDADDVAAALDLIPTGAMIVSEFLEVICVNRQASNLLNASDVFRVRQGVLSTHRPVENNALMEAVQSAHALADGLIGASTPPAKLVAISRPSKLPLKVLSVPLRPRYKLRQNAGSKARVLLMIYDPQAPLNINITLLESFFGLTFTEAIVAARLAEGRSIADIATERRCSSHTVRAHLKSVFRKTDTNRQAELVQIILTNQAMLSLEYSS